MVLFENFFIFMKVKTRKVLTFVVKTLKNHETSSTCALETTFFLFKNQLKVPKVKISPQGKINFKNFC